jgi:hypothetical protein
MFLFVIALLFLTSIPSLRAFAESTEPAFVQDVGPRVGSTEAEGKEGELPDSPGALLDLTPIQLDLTTIQRDVPRGGPHVSADSGQSRFEAHSSEEEPYHWKGLLLQSFAFDMLQNATRIITADQNDRHLLLNKPYWSDYWASLQQFNMRRWNDGDSISVNYIGHPMEGAIAGYIEVQNDPRGRLLQISRDSQYWKSRWRAFLWATVYSTAWEIGPIGETAIFNQGGFTYPLGCKKHDLTCEATAKYTNNTGWVDFIITPTVGTLWLIGEDTLDRYVTNPLVHRHPNAFGYKLMRASLNPSSSLANMLRGHYPWWRDYEHPGEYESVIVGKFERAMDEVPKEYIDVNPHYTALGLGVNHTGCFGCPSVASGVGLEVGVAVRRYLDVVADGEFQPGASPLSSLNVGGSLVMANFGVRSGYSGDRFALKLTLAPGFASYSKSQPEATDSDPYPAERRNFNFSAVAALSADVRFTSRLAFRTKVSQVLIRYKSTERDPPGIGTAPRLSFLSHDNYINSTNWGISVGPVIRF